MAPKKRVGRCQAPARMYPSRTLSARPGGLNQVRRIFQDLGHRDNFTTFPWNGFPWIRECAHHLPEPFWLMSRRTSYLHRGLSQGGNRITVEVLLTGFLFAYDVVMSGLWHGQSRLPMEVHHSGLSASRRTSVGLGQSQGYEERQPHAHVGFFGQSTMDVSRLFLPKLRVARLLPQLQSRRQLWGTWKQWRWQSCKEAGSASDFRGLPLGGVRKVARRRLSQLGGDGSGGFGSSQGRGARPPEGFGCEHCEPREGARRQAGCGCRRGSSAEEVGETGAQGSDAVPQVYQVLSSKRRSRQGKRRSSSSRVCRRKRWI